MLIMLITLLVLAEGCQKDTPVPERDGHCLLTVSACVEGKPLTRAVGVTDASEKAVSSLQTFYYRDGLYAGGTRSEAGSVSTSLPFGAYDLYVLANAPEVQPADVPDTVALLQFRSRLGDNGVGRLVAFGHRSLQVTTGEKTLIVDARHTASTVILDRITRDFSGMGPLKDSSITVHSVYLTNVATDCTLGGGAPDAYVNKLGWKGEIPELTYDDVEAVVETSVDTRHTFYLYPNPVERDSVGGGWSPRHSRLVVSATVAGQDCFYVVNLPVIGSNRIYEITNLIITRIGSSDEETIADDSVVVVESVTLEDWQTDVYELTLKECKGHLRVTPYDPGSYNENLLKNNL